MSNRKVTYLLYIFSALCLFISSCKEAPTLADSESDPFSLTYRPDPPQNLVTFKNYEENNVGISWIGNNEQPLSGYIISASKTGHENSYKRIFDIDSSKANSENIYEVLTPLIHKSTKEFYKTETYYIRSENDTAFSDPIYSSIAQYVYGFHTNFVSDSTPNFQFWWNHSFLNDDEIEVQVSGDSVNFETIYSGSISQRYFDKNIETNLQDVFLRFRIKTEQETTEYYPIDINNNSCLEYLGDTFFYVPQASISYGSNITYTFDNSACDINEIILLEGGFSPERPLREIKRVSKYATTVGMENLDSRVNYYFWLQATTDHGKSTLTKAYRVGPWW